MLQTRKTSDRQTEKVLRQSLRHIWIAGLLAAVWTPACCAQQTFTWSELRAMFEANNPTIVAGRIGIDESRAAETTAYLRPNPNVTGVFDQLNFFTTQAPLNGSGGNTYNPFRYALPSGSIDYLHERQNKRELRLESAKKGTAVAESQLADQERTLLFNLRSTFVDALQAEAVLALANRNLSYYDDVLRLSQIRKQAGDIAQVDLDRLELQRAQYESDVQTATVNVRTAKIQLLTLLNDRTPVEKFDVTGPFDFSATLMPLEELRSMAVANRPDLRAAAQAVDKARTDHLLAMANGSTDPTFSMDFARNPPIPVYVGFSVSIPLRIFDRNQGEKLRTQLDVARSEKLVAAAEAQVFSDVDSAYATMSSNLTLLKSYKARYLQQAVRVRETISFSYRHGGASLLDFLQAQQDYRTTELNYLNLVGSYLMAAAQVNLAVGLEVIQ
jgi:outer membrane protein, heavy metal efflux system